MNYMPVTDFGQTWVIKRCDRCYGKLMQRVRIMDNAIYN